MDILLVEGIDISHVRLLDLTRLADQAKPFYDWVELQFQKLLNDTASLQYLLNTLSQAELINAIAACYDGENPPFLFDGIGRTYPHHKACFYFFAWLIRDAPQQRLSPLIQRIVKISGRKRQEVEIEVLSRLIDSYRPHVRTFTWDVTREVIIDRLEGSRRSIKGREKEIPVRTALLAAFQTYFTEHRNYGIHAGVEIPDTQVMIGSESYDVSVNLLNAAGERQRRILIPVKTRETEGGGHAHLFSRDIMSAINSARFDSADDYLMVVIIARNWSQNKTENLRSIVDHLIVVDGAPGDFDSFDEAEQKRLNQFIAGVLEGSIFPKSDAD